MSNRIISPISIDLGAKNTGVYFAHYEEGSSIENIEKEGKVYQLEKDKYTLLMANRTAARHQRRGYDRRQMVKRLFKLIWEKHFKLEWDKDVQQTTSFLLNRRGFTFLTEEYDKDILSQFPIEAYELLPDELKYENENGERDFASTLTEWTNKGKETVSKIYEVINKEPKRIAERQVFIGRTEKLREYCEIRKKDEITENPKSRIKLAQLSKWIWDKWQQNRVQGLDESFIAKNDDGSEVAWKSTSSYDLVTYINKQSPEVACQILGSLPDTSKENKELAKSIWNFKAEHFKIEGQDFTRPEPPPINANKKEKIDFEKAKFDWMKCHLQHLAFALHKTLNELESGGRHRSKYFKEINSVLINSAHTHGYLKNFCRKLQSGDYPGLDEGKLAKLVSHLSNLELKPLRKYFNDKAHQKSDYWDKARLSRFFELWFLHEWRVNLEKDKNKAPGKPGDYEKLKKYWSSHKEANPNTVIDFWMKTDPVLTIPPYQDNNNRRPPKCQSLILNPTFLDEKYPAWQHWLSELRKLPEVEGYLKDFGDHLKNLKSGKNKSYFPAKEPLDARVFQFILDRIKADDPLKLNEIYSHAKKWRQEQSTEQEKQTAKSKLEEAIQDSCLPDGLKTDRDYSDEGLFKEGAFLHLVCKYYKQRQRARDGRLFIHPKYRYVKNRGYENTGRFDDKNCLLTYCNHKPRQKKYQSFHDIACVFQISPDQLQKIIGSQSDNDLVSWLKEFRGLPSLCTQSAEAQKKHRGELKTLMDSVIREDRKRDSLYKLNTSLEKVAGEVGKALFAGDEGKILDQRIEKFRSPFSFAQINNIAFKDRSGNSNTCPTCSIDNAHRMQMVASKVGKENHAKAQRLPALPTRLIDGAVMRIARIVGGAIAEDKWKKIECELEAGNRVHVPIITESNRFEFEPSREELVRNQRTQPRKGKPLKRDNDQALFNEKTKRIKLAGRNICPYEGIEISNGEVDHITPRSSGWGTLNDEANLIWASHIGNHHKFDTPLPLGKLAKHYKDTQFQEMGDEDIEKWIISQIGDAEGELFKFGKYRSFINLTPDQQKAFRHALFLVGHELRNKVIRSIDNRTRTVVNGTQRYFAEVLANNLYKKAKKSKIIKNQHLLSFDYFGVEAHENSRGDGIYDLRKEYEKVDSLVKEFSKTEDQKQKPYSHLIDAQLAFAIAVDKHKNDGSLRLTIHDSTRLWPTDKGTGEIFEETIFNAIHITPEQLRERNLERKKPDQTFFSHRSIHRDGIYAERYTPILVHKVTSKVRIGFDWNNSYELKDKEADRKKLYFALQFNLQGHRLELTKDTPFKELKNCLMRSGFCSKTEYFCIPLNVQAIHDYYVENYNTSKGYQKHDDNTKFLRSLSYRTEKKKITTLEEARKILNKKDNFQIRPKSSILTLPVREEWKRLIDEWEKTELRNDAFLKCFFEVPGTKPPHEKVRKVFSLPIKSGEGKFLIKRNSWSGENIFQIVNDSDSRKVDTKAFVPAFIKSNKNIGKLLSASARSEKLFLLVDNEEYHDQINSEISEIDPCRWFPVTVPDELCKFVKKIEYRIDNNTRPQIRFTPSSTPTSEQIDVILENSLLKPRDKQTLKTQIQEVDGQSGPIEYTGASFQGNIRKALSPVFEKYYQ